jgi:hypothetical protein
MVLEVVAQTRVDPKNIEISTGVLAAFVGLIFAFWHAIGQERPDGPRFCIHPCLSPYCGNLV